MEAVLSMGWHTVPLTATDGQGLTATDQVTFYVGYAVHLPLVCCARPTKRHRSP